MAQCAFSLLMILPRYFGFNDQTAESNVFQSKPETEDLRGRVITEFYGMTNRLNKRGIKTLVFENSLPDSPDAVFPNNWISFHEGKKLVIYPMEAPNRRREVRDDILEAFSDYELIDLRSYEQRGQFLEGTGSLVLDHKNRWAYMALSSRSHLEPAKEFSQTMGYQLFTFNTRGPNSKPLYHTNVMMSLGEKTALVCFECIDPKEKAYELKKHLKNLGYEIVELRMDQIFNFSANALKLQPKTGQGFWFFSERGLKALDSEQKKIIEQEGEALSVAIPCIENVGGGSVRCMMAEMR